jgi:hypothetical protein
MVIYPAMTAFTDQYSLPNIFFDIGQSTLDLLFISVFV